MPRIDFIAVEEIVGRALSDVEKERLSELYANHWIRSQIVLSGVGGPALISKVDEVLARIDGGLPFHMSAEDRVWDAIKYHLWHSDGRLKVGDVIDEALSKQLRESLQVLRVVYKCREVFRGQLSFSPQDNWVAMVQDLREWCNNHFINEGYASRSGKAATQVFRRLILLVDQAAPKPVRARAFEEPTAVIKRIQRSLKYRRAYDPGEHR